jgi:hypothetical protein
LPELNVGLFDVVFVEGVLVGVCQDRRPGILVKFVGDEYFQFAPCSSQWSLFRPGRDFPFSETDPSTAAMGFIRPSYAVDIPFAELPRSAVKRRLGHLGGNLAEKFLDWAKGENPLFLGL